MRRALKVPRTTTRSLKTGPRRLRAWKLQDAKAHLSQLVREAQQQGPQCVTVHGRDAVVILSAQDHARLAPAAAQPSLHALLSQSLLRVLDFAQESVRTPVRDVEL